VIPLGLDLHEYRSHRQPFASGDTNAISGAEPYILSLSRLTPTKGIDLLLEAFLDLLAERDAPRVKLVIAGEGERGYVATLKRRAAASKYHDRVIFAGWLDGNERIAALQAAHLFALPSEHENFGVSVSESLACGVPVLVTPNVGIAGEVAIAGAGWVAQRDVTSIRNVLASVLDDENERVKRGEAARRLAQRFSSDRVALDLLRLYSSLSDSKQPVPFNGNATALDSTLADADLIC
jgi:glycosyltransferase involved in cell wall biosynthesis